MIRALRLHPDCRRNAAHRIDVSIVLQPSGRLDLRYDLIARTDMIALPRPAPSLRTDELWRHSCFEAFLRPSGGESYCEFNFSPSTQWAAYGFDGYRNGMHPLDMPPPQIIVARDAEHVTLEARFQLPESFAAPLRLALCAVIEERDGTLSYWALNHPAGKPDFHHPDGFALELVP